MYSNVQFESSLVFPWSLTVLLHMKFSSLPRTICNSLLLKDTIAAWKAARDIFKLPYSLSKHLSLWGHAEFIQGLEGEQFCMWREKGMHHLRHLVDTRNHKFISFQEIQSQYQLPSSHHLPYCQIIGFLGLRLHDLALQESPNLFDSLFESPMQRHTLSTLYQQS